MKQQQSFFDSLALLLITFPGHYPYTGYITVMTSHPPEAEAKYHNIQSQSW